MHNEVNRSLGKSIFDCSEIGDFYDCGCKDDEGKGVEGGSSGEKKVADDEAEPVALAKEELRPGG